MNLRDLEYLVAVADHLHFGKAALAVHVSQPTLSMQLKKLEETLGVQLFERSNKRVMLTAIGHDISGRARRVLEETAHMKRAAQNARDPKAGLLRLGIFPTLAPYLLPSLMPQLTQHFPKLDLQLIEEKTPELIAQLVAGRLDCALLASPVEAAPGLTHRALFREPFLLAVSRQHRLAGRKSVGLQDMQGESVLLLEDGHCLREQALEVCHLAGVGESASFRATSLETLRHMVAAGNAITLMPKLATAGDDQLRYIPFKSAAPLRHIGLYWRAASARSPLFEAMAALMARLYTHL